MANLVEKHCAIVDLLDQRDDVEDFHDNIKEIAERMIAECANIRSCADCSFDSVCSYLQNILKITDRAFGTDYNSRFRAA